MPFLPESKRWLRDVRDVDYMTSFVFDIWWIPTDWQRLQRKQAIEGHNETNLSEPRRIYLWNLVTLSFRSTQALIKPLFADPTSKRFRFEFCSRLYFNSYVCCLSRRILLSLMIAIGQTMTGASAILYYSTYILRSLDLDESAVSTSHFVSEITIGIAKLLGVCCAIILVDRVGRRRLLLFGSTIMLCSHLSFATSFWVVEGSNYAYQIHMFCLWNLYVFIFAWNSR